eukprot:CFRG0345T1
MAGNVVSELDLAWQELYAIVRSNPADIAGAATRKHIDVLFAHKQDEHFIEFIKVATANRLKKEVDTFYMSIGCMVMTTSCEQMNDSDQVILHSALSELRVQAKRLADMVGELVKVVNAVCTCTVMDNDFVQRTLHTSIVVHEDFGIFRTALTIVVTTAIGIFYNRIVSEECNHDVSEDVDFVHDGSHSKILLEKYLAIGQIIDYLRLSKQLITPVVVSTLSIYLNKYINRDSIKGCYEESVLPRLYGFVSRICNELLCKIMTADAISISEERIKLLANKELCELRTSEIFDIIATPESEPALRDLKICLEKTAQKPRFVAYAREILRMRLLHPGADTSPILTQYVDAIKSLRVLDPSSQMVHAVCEPVQHALRQREDTIRCIVQSLTDTEGKKGLLSDADPMSHTQLPTSCNDNVISDCENWQPTPLDILGEAKNARTADIMTMLVGIYGSHELFVNEYQLLLSARLLDSLDFQTDDERRNLELLKMRFGETNLHQCEVMLKDIHNSRRINSMVHELLQLDANDVQDKANSQPTSDDVAIDLTIISRLFWPQLKNHTLVLPEKINKWLKLYEKCYSKYKMDRKLDIKSAYGKVDLSLTFEDWSLDVTVLPDQAAIIMCFENEPVLSIDNLATIVGLAPKDVRRRIGFWENLGVLHEVSHGEYKVQETKPTHDQKQRKVFHMGEEIEIDDASDSVAIELQTCWNYIEAMLVQMESLTAENIHMRLQMFFSGDTPPLNRLKIFLEEKVANDVLDFRLGEYYINH